MKPSTINREVQPPANLYPPADHHSDNFNNWCRMMWKRGYSEQYIAGAANEDYIFIRRCLHNHS